LGHPGFHFDTAAGLVTILVHLKITIFLIKSMDAPPRYHARLAGLVSQAGRHGIVPNAKPQHARFECAAVIIARALAATGVI
jgi:hypothetical protein